MRKKLSFVDALANNIADKIASCIIKEEHEEVINLDFCVALIKQEYLQYPQIKYFVLSVKQNEEPEDENDNFIVTIRFLNEQRRAFIVDGSVDEYVLHTGKIDSSITDFMDGKETVTVQAKFREGA